MKKPRILRKRYIPFETVDISGDELLFRSEDMIITRWKVIKPRSDISRGVSYTFLKEGFKTSRFYDTDGKFIYWYCDIIDVEYDEPQDTYTLADLLVDVRLMADGTLNVLDADELAEAMEKKLITEEQACRALRILDRLLQMVYHGTFPPDICRNQEYWGI